MDRQFHCKNKNRRNAVGFPKDADGNPIAPNLNGIDYLEVKSVDQRTLKIYFLHNLPGETNPVPPPPAQALTKENIRIDGGVRISTIQVESISASEMAQMMKPLWYSWMGSNLRHPVIPKVVD